MIQSLLSNIYLILLLCSMLINQRLISDRNSVNQCGISYRRVINVVTKSIVSNNQTSQQIQQIQQDQIQPVQLPQFGLYEKNRSHFL